MLKFHPSSEPNPLAPILNITVGKVAPGINTLDDLTNQQLERLNQMNANYKLDRDTVLGGYKAHKFILDIPADVWISTSVSCANASLKRLLVSSQFTH